MYIKIFKPLLDFLISSILLISLSPVFLIITLILLFANNGKPFFFQQRPGKNEKIFKLIKFRTMNEKRNSNNELLPDADRLTCIGKLLRKTSLDEIPQLLNVIKGDMSLIGPRPLMIEYLGHYTQYQKRRHEVYPGISGWAQVNGRNAIGWEEKFNYDVWYVQNISFWLDLKIIILTLKKIVAFNEISADGHVTMPRFDEVNKK